MTIGGTKTLKLMEVETSLRDHVAASAWQVVGKRSVEMLHSSLSAALG